MNYSLVSTKARKLYTIEHRCKFIDRKTGERCGSISVGATLQGLHPGQYGESEVYEHQFCQEHIDYMAAAKAAKSDSMKQNLAVSKQRLKANVVVTIKADVMGEAAYWKADADKSDNDARHGHIYLEFSDKRSSLMHYLRSTLVVQHFNAGNVPVVAFNPDLLENASSREIF